MAAQNISPDDIAECVLNTFDKLPAKRKPRQRDDGTHEWVPLSDSTLLQCVALGTGMKCLPSSKLCEAKGIVLHDCHAEILAVRAFNRFLVQECSNLAISGLDASPYLYRPMNGSAERQAFAIHEDVKIHMYCSEAPCGDASMELTMDAQDDPAPWEHPPDQGGTEDGQAFNLHGRGYFSELGAVRRKPARSDAPPTLSKSCSDKLALEQCTSLLSSLTSTLISPTNAYLNSLILPSSQRVPAAVQRAFNASGRMSALECDRKWSGGYDFRPFRVDVTKHEFKNSRRSARTGQKLTASNLSAVWSPHWEETLIGGILQGRKKGDLRGASKLCRRSMLQAVVEVTTLAGLAALRQDLLSSKRYKDFKLSNLCEERRVVKNHVKDGTLRGWIRNNDDDDWTIGPE